MPVFRIPGPLGHSSGSSHNASLSEPRGLSIKQRSFETVPANNASSKSLTNHAYVKVFVWVSLIKVKSPGHAALALRPNAKTPESGYVSFAPLNSGSISGDGNFYSWDEDAQHYGHIEETGKGRGLWIGEIYGLDIEAMERLFLQELANPPRYSISNECATTVHRLLQAGGGDRYASWWSRNVVGFWSPDDVEDYSKSIVNNTVSRGSRSQKYSGDGTLF